MSATATRQIIAQFALDVIAGPQTFAAAANTSAAASVDLFNLASGDTTITLPTAGTVKAMLIVPPPTNTVALTLKGVGGDTGIALSKTEATLISFETAPANFVLNAGATLNGLRIWWL